MEESKIIEMSKLEELLKGNSQRKKVLLVDGQMPFLEKRAGYFFRSRDGRMSDYTPFGLARIAGYLKKHGVPVNLVRLQDYRGNQEALDKIIAEHDIIGISALSPSINDAFNFCSDLKKRHSGKIVVGGAEHLALDYEWILQNKSKTGIDACCTMQGELPLLALSLGLPLDKIGSLAYSTKNGAVIKNELFPQLNESAENGLLKPTAAMSLPKEQTPMLFPEMTNHFKYLGSTQTGQGCVYKCNFCTSPNLYGAGYIPNLETSKEEINEMRKQGIDFFFARDALLNAVPKHLNNFVGFMEEFNAKSEQKMFWGGFYAVKRNESSKQFKRLADVGCIMLGVGLEDIIGDRRNLRKGEGKEVATEFIDEAGKEVMVRALMILGLPEHYKHSRDEIKSTVLTYMKAHPQALYRINLWTPLVGTEDFSKHSWLLNQDIRTNPEYFREHDTMHSVIDPQKAYSWLNVPQKARWVKDPKDWITLRNEIVVEYLQSPEHEAFINGLKDKVSMGRKDLLYSISRDFKDMTLESLKNYGKYQNA